MKPIISRLSQHSTLFFFPLLLLLRWKWRNYIFIVLGIIILAGCFRKFYNTGTTTNVDSNMIERLKAENKYFIIHYRDTILQLDNISIGNNVLTGKSGQLSTEHTSQLNPESNKPNPFKNANKAAVLSEVHLYVNNDKKTTLENPEVNVPLSDIYRMDVYEFNKGRTSTSTIISIVGIVTTATLVAVIIGGIIGSSSSGGYNGGSDTTSCGCPQVYVEQKGNFDYQNGIFSGAVYANLERMDYLPLGNIEPENSAIRLRISGHEDEIQYLNSAQLIGVYHKEGSTILADRYGKFYSISNPSLPEIAMGSDKKDLKEVLSKADGTSFSFNTYDSQETYSKAYLNFKKPLENRKAKLVVRVKNSNWAALLNQEYTLLFGEDYSRYRDYWENTSPAKMEAFILNQGLPIKVYVKNGEKWEYAGYFPLSGTENYRDMVMEIKLPENTSKDLRIKLETVYRFWDLDYAAIDYDEGDSLQTFTIDPVSAKNMLKEDQKDQLVKTDKIYSLLNKDESIDLEFHVPEKNRTNTVSYFLASGGYYHIQNTYPVKANVSRLKQFKKPGEFDRFSREKYLEMEQLQSLANQVRHSSN
ncbi:hypothetical protein FRZ67_18215 [Panacibacter ginsenosidivorans]|uniref:Uncharacterized protein n=1 Tax=Panacibacter ginsenosidivorans TaxID=1813871 RepID=A0A5B8VDS3_9BACT|nr:hypothetical protein [Panacibacter ginsenosidivorans]QEC69153.1 hypothetical protein FRZ67_18215 [Panacibacter ginsenosidivorans]